MVAILHAIFFIIGSLLVLMRWAIILTAIISWLVAFDVINLRNRAMYQIAHFLEAVTRPILRPFQRIIPTLGGVDISPIIVILLLIAVEKFLMPALHRALLGLLA